MRRDSGARWISDLTLGARLAFAGGRSGLVRTILIGVGVGLGVALLLLVSSVPSALESRHHRTEARDDLSFGGEPPVRGENTVLVAQTDTDFWSVAIRGRLLRPEGPRAPLPPGLVAFPRQGEMVVSPALAELLSSPEGALLRPRLPYRVTGTIADRGLSGPREYAYYAAGDRLAVGVGGTTRLSSFGSRNDAEGLDPVLLLLVVIGLVSMIAPIAVLIGTAVRHGGESRDRRLAALRLIGADQGMARRMAAGESVVAALVGLATGVVIFLIGRQLLGLVELWGISVFPDDVRPDPVLVLLTGVLVPSAAVLVTILALRRVMIEPLGVVHQAGGRSRRLWWRLVLPVAGLALLFPLIGSIGRTGGGFNEYQVAAGVMLLLIGVAALLPWLVEAVVARLGGSGVAWRLAVRRLQLDGGTSVRAVSGVAVAVAAGIALQTLFGGVQTDYQESTGQDPRRTPVVVQLPTGAGAGRADEAAGRFRATPGVRAASGHTDASVVLTGPGAPEGNAVPLIVGDCAALRERASIGGCAEGDVFLATDPAEPADPAAAPRPGRRVAAAPADDLDPAGARSVATWLIPGAAKPVTGRKDAFGIVQWGILATPSAVPPSILRQARPGLDLQMDLGRPDAIEHVRNTAAQIDPQALVVLLRSVREDGRFGAIRRALLLGTVVTLLLVGASLLVTMLEQLRERRRLLAALVALGTPRSVLSRSVLWQAAVPMILGLTLAVPVGTALGAILLRMVSAPASFHWPLIGSIAALTAGVVLLVTVLSLPALWRMMRPDGLRAE